MKIFSSPIVFSVSTFLVLMPRMTVLAGWHSHSWFRVSWNSWLYFTLWRLWESSKSFCVLVRASSNLPEQKLILTMFCYLETAECIKLSLCGTTMVNNKTLVNSIVYFKGNLGEKREIMLANYKNTMINKRVKITQYSFILLSWY
jgi:hypothetical protein